MQDGPMYQRAARRAAERFFYDGGAHPRPLRYYLTLLAQTMGELAHRRGEKMI